MFTFTESCIRTSDGIKLAVYRWERKDNEKAPICFIAHGMSEYALRYKRLVDDLEETGWAFAAFDMRGHGYSEGEPMRMKNIDQSVLDLAGAVEWARGQGGNRPVVLLGHSFGGLLATLYASKFPHNLSGIILSSPAFGMHFLFPCMDKAIALLRRIVPGRTIPKPVRPDRLSRDPAVQNAYREDKRIYKFVGVDFLYEMQKGMRFAEKNISELRIPLLMILSGTDEVVDNRKSITFFDRLLCADKEMKMLDGFRHETFNELDRSQPVQLVKQFLNKVGRQLTHA